MGSIVISGHLGNLSIFTTGYEECAPCHSYSTAFTDQFLLHYIISGKGFFSVNGKRYDLKTGNAFLIGSQFGYYEADEKEPWTYMWINFSGEIALEFIRRIGLGYDDPIYTTNNPQAVADCFRDILDMKDLNNDYLIYSKFFYLLGQMQKTNVKSIKPKIKATDKYIEQSLEYIHSNYYRNISIKKLCDYIGLEYSYLFRLFKVKLNKSPGKYISDYKLIKARELLDNTEMAVSEIARAVGYEDRIVFSRAFVQKYGVSPANYRKSMPEAKPG